MKKIFIVLLSLLLMGCLSVPETDSPTTKPNNEEITVTYTVTNNSRATEWVVIIYKDVLGDIENELYMKPGEIWEIAIKFRLGKYGSEYLSLEANSLHGTFVTTITINDIKKSVRSGSQAKPGGKEYRSYSSVSIDRETVDRYRE